MARAKRDNTLEGRSNRLKLKPTKEPLWASLAEGEHVGYSRPKSLAAGTWKAKWRDKDTGKRNIRLLGTADDYEDADGIRILDWGQAQAKARDWFKACSQGAQQAADGEEVHTGPYTVADAMADYTRDCERRGVKGLDRQAFQVNAHIIPALGTVEVAKLSRGRIEKWMDVMAASPRRVRTAKVQPVPEEAPKPRNFKVPREKKAPAPPPAPPMTANEKRARKDSTNRVLTILKAALNYAHEMKKVRGEVPWQSVKPYKGTTAARVRFLSIEDQVRFVRACPPDFQQLVTAALHTGARFGELTQVTVAEYNREAQTLFIPEHMSKGSKARHIFLTEEGKRFFEAVTAGQPSTALIFQRGGEVKRRGRESGQAWDKGDQTRSMEAACKAAGLDRLTFHELRHTAASTWIAAGMDLILVARQLGHSDTRMVEKHYGHLCPNAAAARFRALAPELGLDRPKLVAALEIRTS